MSCAVVHAADLEFLNGAAEDSTVRLWSLDPHFCMAGKSLRTAARALGFSPDGGCLTAGLANGVVLLLDASRGAGGDFGFEVTC